MKTIIRALLLIALGAGPAAAKELFVDQKHPQAGDRNPGTEAQPFKTILVAVTGVLEG